MTRRGRAVLRRIAQAWVAAAVRATLVVALGPAWGLAGEERPLVVRFGMSSEIFFDVSPKDAQVALEVWAKRIVAGARRPVEASGRVLNDVDALAGAVVRNEVDVVALPTMDYLRLRDQVPIVPALVGSHRNGPQDEHTLLVRRDTGLAGLKALAGTRLLIQSGALGVMTQGWLDILLAKQGYPEASRFFGSIKGVGKASQAVLPVFFRQVDAAVVTRASYATLLEMNPQVGRELVSIAESPKLLMSVMCFQRKAEEEVRRVVADSAADLENSAAGRQVLLLFKVAKVIPFEPAFLEGVAALYRDHRALRGGLRRG
jgi:ABC-type phosphate/phosphonate transport system substrate-binding protein